MKCPHRIEPHQIQGLDFIHIFPVVQWLVKRAIETREEMGDYIRNFSESQFNKNHTLPADKERGLKKPSVVGTLTGLGSAYRTTRQYKKPASLREQDEETAVNCTLLEYGRRYGLSGLTKMKKKGEKESAKAAIAASLGGQTEEEAAAEEKRMNKLMKGMEATKRKEDYISSQLVGSIVGMQSEEIKQMAEEYEGKRAGLVGTDGVRVLGAQAHQRMMASMRKELNTKEKRIEELSERHADLKASYEEAQNKLVTAQTRAGKIMEAIDKLDAMVTDENREVLEKLRALVVMNESIKQQEQQFKSHCQEERARLQQAIADLKEGGAREEDERVVELQAKFDADREKLQKIRTLLARKNREIALLQRKIDEVPSRTELAQYQKRLVELIAQVTSTGTETRQFYDLYNSSVDERDFMEREYKTVTSIHENFDTAMSSERSKELYLKQFDQILENIRNEKTKFEKKQEEEKTQKDRANDDYLSLVDKQRQYYKTVKEFQEECRKNEVLLMKVQSLGERQ
jgi:hypothetical protein